MRKKLRSRRGFSLSEMLICVALLALMTAAGTTVSATVLNTRNDMMNVADAQVLASTLLESIANEIRYGEDVRFEDLDGDRNDELVFTSATYGENTHFEVADNRVVALSDAIPDVGDINGKLLPDGAYTSLLVADLTFSTGSGDAITISITVRSRRSTATGNTWTKSLTVTPMNGLKTA